MSKPIIVALAAFLALSGCATTLDSPQKIAFAQAGFEIAARNTVVRLVNDRDKAVRIAQVGTAVKTLIEDGAVATLDDIEAAVRQEVDFDSLAPEDRLLAEDLITLVRLAAVTFADDQDVEPSAVRLFVARAVEAVVNAARLRADMLGAPIPIPPVAGQAA